MSAGHSREQVIRYADCLDHVLAAGALHAHGACETCDWIRIRPARAFASSAEAARALAEMAAPRLREAEPA